MVFIMDDSTLETMCGETGIKFGGQAEVTLGSFGRSVEGSVNLSSKGAGGTVSVSFSKGAFGGISIEGAIVAPRAAVNNQYYNSSATPSQILFEDAVTVPKDSLMPEVYKKLKLLASGETFLPSEEDRERASAALAEAQEAAKKANTADDVEEVDAKKLAEKEGVTDSMPSI